MSTDDSNDSDDDGLLPTDSLLRRTFLTRTGGAILGSAVLSAGQNRGQASDRSGPRDIPQESTARLEEAYNLREELAAQRFLETDDEITYDAEKRLPGATNRHTKCLPHDENGEPDTGAYETLIAALRGETEYQNITLSAEADRLLENPSAANSYTLQGTDPYQLPIPPNPPFESAAAATEMVELYWMSLARDVPFSAYDTDQTIQDAADELAELDSRHDLDIPTTPETLFRGAFEGALSGPYISQFLYRPIQRGTALTVEQKYNVQEGNCSNQFLTDFEEWLRIQNGAAPTGSITRVDNGDARYLMTARDLATYVHANVPFQAYLGAAIALLANGAPLDVEGSSVESRFIDYGLCEILSTATAVMRDVQRWTWVNKWLIHQRLRPEEFGGRIAVHLDEDRAPSYPIDDAVLNSTALSRVQDEYDTHLLPQAYPEGSPMHPSYPAGHATIEGSGIAVLKSFFDTSATIEEVFGDVLVPSDDGQHLESYTGADASELTVGSELDKLASNMARGRDMAGIHYWTDGVRGIRYGEQFGIEYLKDELQTQDVDRLVSVTTVDGEEIDFGECTSN